MIRFLDEARLALLRAARLVGLLRRPYLRPGESFPGRAHALIAAALLDAQSEAAR